MINKSANAYSEILDKESVNQLFSIIIISIIIFVGLGIYIWVVKKKLAEIMINTMSQEKWFDFISSNIKSGIMVVDNEGVIRFVNKYALNIIGVSKKEILNRLFEESIDLMSEDNKLFELPNNEDIFNENNKVYKILSKNNNKFNVTISVVLIEEGEFKNCKLLLVDDVSNKVKSDILLKKERDFSKIVIDNSEIFIVILDLQGKIISMNNYALKRLDIEKDDIKDINFSEIFIDNKSKEKIEELINGLKEKNIQSGFENKIVKTSSEEIDILWKNSFLIDENNEYYGVVVSGIDITERKGAEAQIKKNCDDLATAISELGIAENKLKIQYDELQGHEEALRSSEERYRIAVEGSNDGLWDWDIINKTLFFSPRWKEILGYKDIEIANNYDVWIDLMHIDDVEGFKQAVEDHLEGRLDCIEEEFRLKTKDGNYKWVLCRGKAIKNKENKPIRIAGSQTDITERKRFEEKINKLAYYDTVTELPNRTYLFEFLEETLKNTEITGNKGVLVFLDLDNFKTINDTLGHTFGDELLRQVGNMLKEMTGKDDFMAHFGADEFVVIKSNIGDEAPIDIANNIVKAFQRPWKIDEREFFITASVGMIKFPDDGNDVQTLLKNVDTAMYHAKELGRNKYEIYTKEMNKEMVRKLEIHNDLRHAIERDEFLVFYQPQIDLHTGKIVSVEALTRWLKPSSGIVQPMRFIGIAEETGVIVEIGEWVLKTSCEQNIMWKEMGLNEISIAVNFSARQFQMDSLVSMIDNILKSTKMKPQLLEVEITESIVMENMSHTIKVLNELRKMGVKISLDDFGTGYSSLNYLRKLPIDMLKIDKSFVRGLNVNKDEQAIAKAVIDLAHSLHLSVTAEGVETVEQLKFLIEHKCDKVQGFLFSKPVPACELESLLATKGSLIEEMEKNIKILK